MAQQTEGHVAVAFTVSDSDATWVGRVTGRALPVERAAMAGALSSLSFLPVIYLVRARVPVRSCLKVVAAVG
jgi:hypothetical protein